MTDMSVSFPRQGAPWEKRLCLVHLHLLRSKHHVTNFSWTGRIQQSLKVIYLTPRWLVCELLIAWYHQGNRALVLQFCLLFFICKKGGITSKPWACVWSAIEWPRHGAGWMKWVCGTQWSASAPEDRVAGVVLELRHPQKEELLMLCVLLCAHPPHTSNPHGQETGPPRGKEESLCFLLRPFDSCPSPSGLTSTGNLLLHVCWLGKSSFTAAWRRAGSLGG